MTKNIETNDEIINQSLSLKPGDTVTAIDDMQFHLTKGRKYTLIRVRPLTEGSISPKHTTRKTRDRICNVGYTVINDQGKEKEYMAINFNFGR